MAKKPIKSVGPVRPKGQTTPIGEAVGKRIRSRREEIGLTQEQLGDRLSDPRSKGMISQWEKGVTTPTLEQIREISRILVTDQMWVAFGGSAETIALSGRIISGGLVMLVASSTEYVPVPPTLSEQGIRLCAWRVDTDGIPSLHSGDIIFTSRDHAQDERQAIGYDAVVELANGDHVLRRIERSDKPNCITLVDQRGLTMLDIAPMKVWIVLSIVKASAVALFAPKAGKADI